MSTMSHLRALGDAHRGSGHMTMADLKRLFEQADTLHRGQLNYKQFEALADKLPVPLTDDTVALWKQVRGPAAAGQYAKDGTVSWQRFEEWADTILAIENSSPSPRPQSTPPEVSISHHTDDPAASTAPPSAQTSSLPDIRTASRRPDSSPTTNGARRDTKAGAGDGRAASPAPRMGRPRDNSLESGPMPLVANALLSETEDQPFTVPQKRGAASNNASTGDKRGASTGSRTRSKDRGSKTSTSLSPAYDNLPHGVKPLNTALEEFFKTYTQQLERADDGRSEGLTKVREAWESMQHRGLDVMLEDIAQQAFKNTETPSHVVLQTVSMGKQMENSGNSSTIMSSNSNATMNDAERRKRHQANTLSFASALALEHVLRSEGAHWEQEMSLLFIDVTGYADVSRQLEHENPYTLSMLVNKYIDRILKIVFRCGGDVVKFAGDSVFVAWRSNTETAKAHALAAVLCAQELMEKAGTFDIPDTSLSFGIHIGCASGLATSRIFQPPQLADDTTMQRCFHFLTGTVMVEVTNACDAALPGQCVIAHSTLRALGPGIVKSNVLTVANKRGVQTKEPKALDGMTILESAETPEDFTAPMSPKRLLRNEAGGIEHKFIPPLVSAQVLAGVDQFFMAQTRDLVVLFVGFAGDACDEAVWFTEVHGVMTAHGCSILQVSHDNKGTHIVAAFNLFLMEHKSADSAVDLALTLRAKHSDSYIGMAAGRVLTGAVGSKVACQWDISGHACVRACHLMRYAMREGHVAAIDESVYKAAMDHSVLRQLTGDIQLKEAGPCVDVYILKPVPRGEKPKAAHIDRVPHLHFSHSLCSSVHETMIETVQNALGVERPRKGGALGGGYRRQARAAQDTPQVRTVVLKGAVGTGKFSLCLNAISGTPFVPLVHTAAERDKRQALTLVKTISTWFSSSIEEDVQLAARAVSEALANGFYNDAFNLAVALIRLVRQQDILVALIVRRAQFLDESSVSFLAAINRELGGMNKTLNWINLLTCYPLCGNDHPERVFESFKGVQVFAVEHITSMEANALFCHTVRAKVTEDVVRFTTVKTSNFAEYVVELANHLKQIQALTVTPNGQLTIRRAVLRDVEKASWLEIAPAVAMKTTHIMDRLSPQLLIMAKIVCAITEQPGISAFFYSVNRVTQMMQSMDLNVKDVQLLDDLKVLQMCEHLCSCHKGGSGELDAARFYMSPMRDIVSGILVPQQRTEINNICGDVYADTHPMNHPMQYLVRARHFLFADRHDDFVHDIRKGWEMLRSPELAVDAIEREAIKHSFMDWMADHIAPDVLSDFVEPAYIKRMQARKRMSQRASSNGSSSAVNSTRIMIDLTTIDRTPRPLQMGPAREFLRSVVRALHTFVECAEDSANNYKTGHSESPTGAKSFDDLSGSDRSSYSFARRGSGHKPTVPAAVVERLKDNLSDYVLVLQLSQAAPRVELSAEQQAHQDRIEGLSITEPLTAVADRFGEETVAIALSAEPTEDTTKIAADISRMAVRTILKHVVEDLPMLCELVNARGVSLLLESGTYTATEVIHKFLTPKNVGFHVDLAELLKEQRDQRDSVLHALELLGEDTIQQDKHIAVLLYEHLPNIVMVHCEESTRLQVSFFEGLREFYLGLLEPDDVHAEVRTNFITFMSLWTQCCRQASLFK